MFIPFLEDVVKEDGWGQDGRIFVGANPVYKVVKGEGAFVFDWNVCVLDKTL